jgi:ketosteroid isomerase-like protein
MSSWIESSRTRMQIAIPAVIALAAGVGLGWQMGAVSADADESATAIAAAEIDRFYRALSGDGSLEDVLGDAFQLIRTDGRRYDREAYLAAPSSLTGYTIDGIRAFESDDVLTATFTATVTGQVGGQERETVGLPRMAVLGKADGGWKLQAFANLGQGLASRIDAEARQAVETWVGAVASGDAAAVRDILAPEFQIVRSDGAAYDAAEYLAGGIPRIDALVGIDDVVATGFGDHMVVRYALNLTQTVADGRIEGTAPRLTVFRRHGDDWLVVAHANFGRVEK